MKKPGSQRTIQRPSAKISRWTEPLVQRIRRLVWHPILHALLIAAVGAWAAFWWAARVKGPPHGVLQSKAVELLFGAVIAGIVKILLDSVQRAREERSHQ